MISITLRIRNGIIMCDRPVSADECEAIRENAQIIGAVWSLLAQPST
jgi:hypothetical protein